MQSNGTLVLLRNDTAAREHHRSKFALRSTFDFERPPRRCLLSQTQRGVTAINKPFSICCRGRRVGFIAEWCSTSKWFSHHSPKSLDTPFIFSAAAAFLSNSQVDEAFWERPPLTENCRCFSICLPNIRKYSNDCLVPVFFFFSLFNVLCRPQTQESPGVHQPLWREAARQVSLWTEGGSTVPVCWHHNQRDW